MARNVTKKHEQQAQGSESAKVLRHRRPEEHTVYSDSAYVQSGYFGFHFSFGVQFSKPDPKSGPIPVYEYSHVGMSPEHAKRFHEILGKQLEGYEEKFGPIRPYPSGLDVESDG